MQNLLGMHIYIGTINYLYYYNVKIYIIGYCPKIMSDK